MGSRVRECFRMLVRHDTNEALTQTKVLADHTKRLLSQCEKSVVVLISFEWYHSTQAQTVSRRFLKQNTFTRKRY